MEKVNKANSIIQKGTRNQVNFKKSQKDVAKNAKELVKLGKEAKKIKSAVKNAKDVTDPDKKWEEMMDDFIKTSEKLDGVADKTNAVYPGRQGRLRCREEILRRLPRGIQGGRELLTSTSQEPAVGGREGVSALDVLICFDQTLSSVAENLALDEALLIEADQGRGAAVLRFWEPREYAVVLGASRRLRDDVLVDACRADGVPILRRSSGGGTVVVGPGTLNVTVVLPESMAPGLAAVETAQRYVLERIARSIRGWAGRSRSRGEAISRWRAANAAAVRSDGSRTGSWSTARSSTISPSSGSSVTWRFPTSSRTIARADRIRSS